jgi:predicted RNase H-related nuclease YkuK (DUF458 family)
MRKAINIDEVRDFILAQTPETKIYIGGDSERFLIGKDWYADYIMVVVVHINGNNGCKIFGEVQRERDWDKKRDKPRMRLMNEVYKIAELYLKLHDVLEDREVQVHLDINPNEMHGSSCVINEAVGYIRGMCNVIPLVKPNAWAASYGADRLKHILSQQDLSCQKSAIL